MIERKFYTTIILIGISMFTIGCSESKIAAPKPTTVSKPTPVVSQAPVTTIADLKGAKRGSIAVDGKMSYRQNQSIQFAIDTKGKTGYLYIVYLDNKGQTALLYPNDKAPLSEVNGKYLFPKDFGGMDIRATKDCQGCQEETTTVYAILSKNPIQDISNIKASNLGTQSKGLSMNLSSGAIKNSNININQIQFIVK